MRFGWTREMLLRPPWSPMRSARISACLSLDDLAMIVGASRETLSSIERGSSLPSATLALRIARALDTTVEELFAADELR
jgi:putative transcriptional regulator